MGSTPARDAPAPKEAGTRCAPDNCAGDDEASLPAHFPVSLSTVFKNFSAATRNASWARPSDATAPKRVE